MTHFEYIFVAVSIILSFTLLRLLDALPHALDRRRGYWPHAVWVVFLLYFCATYWWISWHNRIFEELSLRYFLFLLLAPSVLYLSATALVSATPASVTSWREHFFRVRIRFFTGLLLYLSMLIVNTSVTFGVPLRHPLRIAQAIVVGLVLAGALVSSPRGQTFLGGLAAAVLAAALGLAVADRAPLNLD